MGILNLTGERRLYGWPEQWPDQSDRGHFILQQPEWVLDDGTNAPLFWNDRILMPAGEVIFVEFLKPPGAFDAASPEVLQARERLLSAQKKGADDDDENRAAC